MLVAIFSYQAASGYSSIYGGIQFFPRFLRLGDLDIADTCSGGSVLARHSEQFFTNSNKLIVQKD
jgi:hypothetical protein